MQRWKCVYDLIEKCDCILGYQRSEAEIESEDGQFSQRCHFLITYTSIRVRQDARFDISANINILHQSLQTVQWSNIHFNGDGDGIAAQSGKKTVKNCWNSTFF